MEYLKEKIKNGEFELLTTVIDFYFKRGWLTENEKLRVDLKETLKGKKVVLYNLMKNVKCETNSARLLCAIRSLNEVDFSLADPKSDESRNHYLSILMSNLFDKDLITQEEMLEFQRSVKFENQNSIENITCEELSLIEPQVEQGIESSTVENPLKNPMDLSPVIRCILQYLNVEDIKKCRYISKEWASEALSVLTTRSKIIFSHTLDGMSKTPVKFFQVFPDTDANIVPFSAFSIAGEGCEYSPWSIKELNYFFNRQAKYIFELELHELYLEDDDWEKIEKFEITPWLKNSPIVHPNAKRRTQLSIQSEKAGFGSTQLFVDLSTLSFVNHLNLHPCCINLQNEIRMSPITLRLSYIKIHKDGNALAEISLTDILDFCNAKRVHLKCTAGRTIFSIQLDKNEKVNLQCLDLQDIVIRNWRKCRWTVNQISLTSIPFTEPTEMKIKEFNSAQSTIDFRCLPLSLERLNIWHIRREDCLCSQLVVLNNLKTLRLNFLDDCFATFSQNFKCPNLNDLTLEINGQMDIDVQWFSATIKVLRLYGVKFKNEQNKELNLDTLILNYYFPADVKNMLTTRIQTKELVLKLPSRENVACSFLDFLEYYDNILKNCGSIYVGEFNWYWDADLSPNDCPMRNYVDFKSEYYVFKNGKGKAINFCMFPGM